MTIKEVHLRDALEPLAGDPVQDAARVLQELPKGGMPPIAYWLLGAGLTLGLTLGMVVGSGTFTTSSAERDPVPTKLEENTPKKEDERREQDDKNKIFKKEKEKEKKEKEWNQLTLYAFGQVEVTEPDATPVMLEMGYKVELGSKFRTLEGRAGMLFADQSQLRADFASVFSVLALDQIRLDEGQIWTSTGEESQGRISVRTPLGFVDVERGSSNIELRDGRLQVVCLIGEVEIQPIAASSAPIRLTEGQMGWCTEHKSGGPNDAGFIERHTSWMTKLLLRQQDDTEVVERIEKMIKLYYDSEYRAEAARELTKLGAAAVPRMVRVFLEREDVDPQFRRETAQKIGNAAENTTVEYLFYLLPNPDPEVRVIAFDHTRRITGMDEGKDESFWRDVNVSVEERRRVIRDWWNKVK